MRAKRILLISGGAAACVLLLALGAAFSPPVQTWAARTLVASAAHRGASLRRLSVGLNRMSLEDLRVAMDGGVLVVPSADAELDVASAVLGRGVRVRNLVAKGWTLDLARSRGPRAAASSAAARGPGSSAAARALAAVLAAFNVPANLSVDGVDLEGTVVLPDEGGRPMGRARVSVAGGGLAAGRSGRFVCGATAALDDAEAPVSVVALRGTLSASMDALGTFTRASVKLAATASGRQFPSGIGLAGEASASREGETTTYTISLSRGAERIASIDAESSGGSQRVSGGWRLDLKDTDLAPFALGRRLPSFMVTGEGRYELATATHLLHSQGRIRASADRLGVVAEELSALGRVDLSADFDFASAGSSLRVDRLEASIAGAAPAASVRALQAFEFNTATGELKVAGPVGDLVGISIQAVPLSWLMGAMPGIGLGGSDAQGEFVIRAEEGRLALRTRAPLSATGVSLSRSGRPVASGLDVSAFLLADYAPQGWQVQLAPLEVRSDGIEMLSIEARLGRLAAPGETLKAAGSWSVRLPALLAQPCAAALPRLAGGDAIGSFEASFGPTRELLVKVALRELAMSGGVPSALPSITSDIRADIEPSGRTAFNIPLHLDYGSRTADLILSGAFSPDGDVPVIDAALSAPELSADDVAAIAALCGRGGPAAGPGPSPGGAPAAAAPFWPSVRGRLSFRVKELAFPQVAMRELRGSFVLDPASLRIESGTANIGEASAVRLDGELKHAAGSPRPYSFWASVAAGNIASAPLFRAMDPDRAPAIDGRFDVTGHLSGEGEGLGDLLDRAEGDCRLSSKDGSFRVLQTDAAGSVKQVGSKLAGALDSVTSLFGKKAEKIAEALTESASALSEIHYDQLSVSAERGPDLSIRVTELALIAPEERIAGAGKITYQEGVPIRDQPLSLDLDLGVRGRLGRFMGAVGMLKDAEDELGYTPVYQPVHLGGTLGRIDQSQWREMLIQAPLRKGSGLIDKLLGR